MYSTNLGGIAATQAMSNLTNQSLVHQSAMARARARRGNPSPIGGAPRAIRENGSEARFTSASLAYRPTPQLSRATVEGYVERLRDKNPAASQAIAEQFGRHDYGSIYRRLVAPFGLRDSNAADALTAYTVLGWMIATGTDDPGRAAVAATRDQIGAQMAADPQVRTPENRAKVAEELKLSFVMLHTGWQSARKEGILRQYADGVATLFQRQGTDLRTLQLSDQGLAAR